MSTREQYVTNSHLTGNSILKRFILKPDDGSTNHASSDGDPYYAATHS